MFRTIYSDAHAAPILAGVASQLGTRAVALLASRDAFGLAGLAALNASCAAAGVDVLSASTFVSTDPHTGARVGDACVGEPAHLAAVQRAVAAARDSGARTLAVSATGPSTQCVFAAAAALGMRPERFTWLATEQVHPPGGWASAWGRSVAAGARGYTTYLGAPFAQAAPLRRFRRDFAALHGREPSGWAAYSYDAVGLVGAALASAPRGQAPRGARLIELLRAAELDGVTGPIRFPRGWNSPPDARLGVLSLAEAEADEAGPGEPVLEFETVGVSSTAEGARRLHLYLQPFLRRACAPSNQSA